MVVVVSDDPCRGAALVDLIHPLYIYIRDEKNREYINTLYFSYFFLVYFFIYNMKIRFNLMINIKILIIPKFLLLLFRYNLKPDYLKEKLN